MHTQRQSYLFKNRSRSPQFSQATQRDKSHQYRSAKTCRSPCVLFFDSFLSIPGNSPFISFSISTSFAVYPCCCETNILLVFSSKSSSGQCLFFFSSPLILLCISLLIISSILIVLMSVFLHIMYCHCAAGS